MNYMMMVLEDECKSNNWQYMEQDELTGAMIFASDGPMSRWKKYDEERHIVPNVSWYGSTEYFLEMRNLAYAHELCYVERATPPKDEPLEGWIKLWGNEEELVRLGLVYGSI